jgi:hypothetical protein
VENRRSLKLIPRRRWVRGDGGGAARAAIKNSIPAIRGWWRSTNSVTSTAIFSSRCSYRGRTVADVLAADHVVDPCRAGGDRAQICEQLRSFIRGNRRWYMAISSPRTFTEPQRHGALLDPGSPAARGFTPQPPVRQPSYCSGRLTRAEVDPQSDLWGLGAPSEMLAGVPPYQAEDTRKLEGLIRSKRPPRALPASCPAAAPS